MTSKKRIIQAAIIVFARYGYRQTNMEVLAKEAGLSRQALYAHFPNKEAVFAAAVEALHGQALDEANRLADKIVTRGGGLEEALLAALEARYIGLLERFAGSAHISELIDAQHRQCSGLVADFVARFEAMISELINVFFDPQRLAEKAGVTSAELAEDVIAAARGIKYDTPPPSRRAFRARLTRTLRLMLSGLA